MALKSCFFLISLLVFSHALLAFAGDYGDSESSYGENESRDKDVSVDLKVDFGKSNDYSKPESKKYGHEQGDSKPKPDNDGYREQDDSKLEFGEKSKPENDGFRYKPDGSNPKAEEFKPKYEEKTKPENDNSNNSENHQYSPDQGHEKRLPIFIEGLVLCKSGPKYYPIPGAVAKVVCSAEDKYRSKKTPFSIFSSQTDSKGYFLADLNIGDNLKLNECKAFLDNSPIKDCKIPTDVNQGVSGALLRTFRILEDKKIKLYSIGPFFFTSESKSIPNGY